MFRPSIRGRSPAGVAGPARGRPGQPLQPAVPRAAAPAPDRLEESPYAAGPRPGLDPPAGRPLLLPLSVHPPSVRSRRGHTGIVIVVFPVVTHGTVHLDQIIDIQQAHGE